MKNADLDIRHKIFDYLSRLFPVLLEDDGYDYEGNAPHLVVYIRPIKDLIGLQHEAIIESLVSYAEFGDDFKDAIQVFYDGRSVYP